MIYFVDLDAPMGGDGLSWETAYNMSYASFLPAGAFIWMKEHPGFLVNTEYNITEYDIDVYGGFDPNLTGTDGDVNSRYGYTKFISDGSGHPCFVFSDSGILLSRLWFSDFENSTNGGAYVNSSSGTIEKCVFENCKSSLAGGGMWSGANINVKETSFIGCESNQGGGAIYVEDGGLLSIEDTSIIKCVSNSGGGGGVNAADINMDRCAVFNNRAKGVTGDGGGMCIRASAGGNYVRDSVIAKNIADNDFGGICSNGYIDFTNDTVVRNKSLSIVALCGGVSSGGGAFGGSVTNSIVKDNTSNGGQVVGFPSNSVGNSNVDGATGTPGGLGGQEGDDCIDEPVTFIDDSYLNPYKLHEDTGDGTKRGGTVSAPSYSGIDKRSNTRETTPSIGAYEEVTSVEVIETVQTLDEIIADLIHEEAREYWTAARVENALVIPTDPVYYQRIHTTLDLIPVTLRILWNDDEDAKAFFMDIVSLDGSINVTGLRLSPGIDLLEGLAIPELGKLFVTDTQMEKAEPTLDGLGDRFILWYLPREATE